MVLLCKDTVKMNSFQFVFPLLLLLNFMNIFETKFTTSANKKGTCLRPKYPTHGYHDAYRFPKIISVGKAIHYRCYSGYELVGNGTRTCLEDGSWSGKEPWCNLTSCSQSDAYSPEHGRTIFGHSVKIGSKIRFECYSGYRRVGAKEAVCMGNGRWSVRPPRCKPLCDYVKCPDGQKCTFNKKNLLVKCTCKNILECPFDYKPICASDKVTYASRCIMGMVSCLQRRLITEVSNGPCSKGTNRCGPCPKITICPAFYKSEYGFLGKVVERNETAKGIFLHFLIEEVYKGENIPLAGKIATVFMEKSNYKCSCVPRLPNGKVYVFGTSGISPSGTRLPVIDERTHVEKFYSHKQMSLCWLY